MKALLTILLLTFAVTAVAGTGFLKGQRINGNVKYCIYNHLGSEYILTIPVHQICRVTIQIND